jgi:hypothetical protein
MVMDQPTKIYLQMISSKPEIIEIFASHIKQLGHRTYKNMILKQFDLKKQYSSLSFGAEFWSFCAGRLYR